MSEQLPPNEIKRLAAINYRDEVLARFKSLHKMLNEACADLANANADLARIDERTKIQKEQEK